MTLVKIILWPILVLVIHVVADIFGLYYKYFWFDVPMHFIGGIAIAISSFYFLKHAEISSKQFGIKLLTLFLILALTALAAVAWEIFEFGMDRIFNTTMQPSVHDTMKDLAFGLLGGAIAGIILLRKS
jgi:signal transduction histidine kinase